MTARDTIPAEVRAMKTSELVGVLARRTGDDDTLRIAWGVGLNAGPFVRLCAAELDARIPPREVTETDEGGEHG